MLVLISPWSDAVQVNTVPQLTAASAPTCPGQHDRQLQRQARFFLLFEPYSDRLVAQHDPEDFALLPASPEIPATHCFMSNIPVCSC